MIKNAIISDCGQYRYSLSRIWDEKLPRVMFIMLNPSTADDKFDDPTIRRCIGFAKSWGYGSLVVGNLYPYREVYPYHLLTRLNPLGEENNSHLGLMANKSEIIVCAWGNAQIVKKMQEKYPEYRPLLNIPAEKLRYIELSTDRTPKHPLYLKKTLTPNKFFEINFKL